MAYPIRTVLWFNGRGREAATFYCSLIPGSRVERTIANDFSSEVPAFEVTDFLLGGVPYQILDAGPAFSLSECVSIMVLTPDQAETDRLWDALIDGGGQPSACGWLKDRYGMSWQITPKAMMDYLAHPDRATAGRAMAALMTMTKIDLAAIEAAVQGPA